MRRQKIENPRVDFPVNLRCAECGERAKHNFEIEESREEYLTLWRAWHSEPSTCVACPFLKGKKKRECAVCGGTGIIWLSRRDGHKRSLIPLPRLHVKVKEDLEKRPLLPLELA